jgi:hydrogenase nickel incorporation protein HypA/HybF
MHELAVTENILEIAVRHGKQAGANRVTDIHIVMGKLSSIVDDSVQFYWDIISEKSICEGAKLHFDRIPAQMQCLDCDKTYTIEQDLTPCPHCNSSNIKLISGEEFWLDSIEIEKDPEVA